mgnify:CR=1 FL=1
MSNKLMMGLWKYVINVPPFLWRKQIALGRKKILKTYEELPGHAKEVHHFVVKELPRQGRPLSGDFIAQKLGITGEQVQHCLDLLERKMTFLFRNPQGEVHWAYPVTVVKTPHRISFSSGEQLYAA